jgi:hypothetical protein
VDLVNLLAAQWGNLFSNVGDLGTGEAVRRGARSVWMGTENRQHLLDHLGLLGTGALPVQPYSAAGPIESGIGDPVWVSMAEWATLCREHGGLAVAAHSGSNLTVHATRGRPGHDWSQMRQRRSWRPNLTVPFFGQIRAGIAIEGLRRGAYPRRIVPATRRPAPFASDLEVMR